MKISLSSAMITIHSERSNMTAGYAEGVTTWCVKLMLSQTPAQFVYIDALSQSEAIVAALFQARKGELNSDDFAQVGIFYTDHMLHEEAKKNYVE